LDTIKRLGGDNLPVRRVEAMSCAVVNSIFMERRKTNRSASETRKKSVINVLKIVKDFGECILF